MSKVGGGAPPPPAAQPQARSAAKKAGPGAKSAPNAKARGPAKSRQGPGLSDEEAETAAGFGRHHDAELEEEGRRHAAIDRDAELVRNEELEHDDVVQGLNFDDERKKRGRQGDEDDTEDAEEAEKKAAKARKAGLAVDGSAGKYFQDMPEDRMGDLSLIDPNDIKRALGPSVRFAQHAMLLAEQRLKDGGIREDALAFLASIYARVGDRQYANKALREFGHATGIVDLYPLELIGHLLEHVPGFCTKVRRDSFVKAPSTGTYRSRVGEPIELTYEPNLRIRGFAIEGGKRPGYLFEPVDPPGTYQLVMLSPGSFSILISAINREGWVLIESLNVEVEDSDVDASYDDLAGLKRERELEHEHEDEPKKKAEPEDLKIHFPKRI